jgi:hypothetical protein
LAVTGKEPVETPGHNAVTLLMSRG